MIKLLTHKNNKNFLRLWVAQIISQFGDRIHQLALVGLIAERAPGSALGLAKLMAFTIIPVFIVQPFAGVFVDRWDRRTTLFVCDLFRGLLVLTIPFLFIYSSSMIPIYAIVFLAFCFSRFYVPAKMSIIPDLVEDDHLPMANSLVSTTGMIAFVLGCALGGFLIDWFGARNGFIIDAFTFLASGSLLFSMTMPKKLCTLNRETIVKKGKEFVVEAKKSVLAEIKEGFQYLIEHKEIRFVIALLYVLLSAAGAIYVVLIVFIQDAFGSITKDLGVLAVSLGLGLFCGALCYGKWSSRFKWYKTMFACLIFGGVMLAIFAYVISQFANIFVGIGLAFLLGLVLGPIFIASNTIVHTLGAAEMRGKVFSALEIVIHFAFLVAMMISSWASQYIEAVWILCSVAVLFTFIGVWGFLKTPHHFRTFNGLSDE